MHDAPLPGAGDLTFVTLANCKPGNILPWAPGVF